MAVEPQGTTEIDLAELLAENVRYLISETGFTIRRAAGLANMGESTMRNFLGRPSSANPGLKTIEDLANALGCATKPWWLLLPLEELKARVASEGLDPFVLPRLGQTSSESTSSGASEAKGDRSRFRAKKAAAGRTSRSSASNRWKTHKPFHQPEWVRVYREECWSRTESEHAARAARTPVSVRETLRQRTLAA